MTPKKLSPERIAKYAALPEELWNQLASGSKADLLGHIEALEAELCRQQVRLLASEGCHLQGEDPHPKLKRLEKELSESRAECERLRAELADLRDPDNFDRLT